MIKECEICGDEFETDSDEEEWCDDCIMAENGEVDDDLEDPNRYGTATE